jgi:enoyl-CoA hydratase
MILALLSLSKPVIALIDGNCMGGGLELALACDYRIGSNSVRLALPEIKRGVWPGTGGIFLLQNLVGRAQAHRILLGGNILDATQAAGLGLLDEHPPQDQLDTRVLEFCAEIANRPLSSIKTICTLLDHQLLDSFKAHLRFELEQFVQAYQQPAAREGNLAFFEKRPPQWH